MHLLPILTLSSLWAYAFARADGELATPNGSKPNIVFILTDDQDKHLDSMDYMQGVNKHLVDKGMTYEHHYCTVALCCPSRVNLLTGKMAHNTKVTQLKPPYGGYEKFVKQGLNDEWLAPWLQKAGYKTYYTGKLMNGHDKSNYNKPFPKGLDGSDFLIGPGTYSYLHPWFQTNKQPPKEHDGYATDLLANKSYGFIDEGAKSNKPFFIMIATVAPHADGDKGNDDQGQDDDEPGVDKTKSSIAQRPEGNAPIPAERHKHLFPHVQVPRDSGNFNPQGPSGASWIRNLTRQGEDNVKYNDLYYKRRLQALQAVDDLVNGTISRLEKHGILNNTYIIYSTDNGYHIGQHRLQPGKSCPYEEDVNIPLVIRGPNIPQGEKSHLVSSHTDMVPTILGWAGADLPKNLDGKAISTNGKQSFTETTEHTAIEHWGDAGFDGKFEKHRHPNTTYKAARVIGDGYNLYYSVWCNNEHELYNMVEDKAQMKNLFKNKTADTQITIGNQHVGLKQLQARLDSLLLVLKDCKGKTCREPWSSLHPKGDVKNLKDALRAEYNDFYVDEQKKVSFDECTLTYMPKLEGPTDFKTFGNKTS